MPSSKAPIAGRIGAAILIAALVLVVVAGVYYLFGRGNDNSAHFVDGYVMAVDANTGDEVWHARTSLRGFDRLVVYGDNLLALGSDDCYSSSGYLVAFAKRDGHEAWRTPADWSGCPLFLHPAASTKTLSVVDGLIAIKTGDSVRGIDAASGNVAWSVEMPGASSVTGAGELALVVAGDEVHALDLKSGTENWKTVPGAASSSAGPQGFRITPVTSQQAAVFLVAAEDRFGERVPGYSLAAVELASGKSTWRAYIGGAFDPYGSPQTDPTPIDSPPQLMAGDDVVLALFGTPASILALDAVTGEQLWRRDYQNTGPNATVVYDLTIERASAYLHTSSPGREEFRRLDARSGSEDVKLSTAPVAFSDDGKLGIAVGGINTGGGDYVPETGNGLTFTALNPQTGVILWQKDLIHGADLRDTYADGPSVIIRDNVMYEMNSVIEVNHNPPGPD